MSDAHPKILARRIVQVLESTSISLTTEAAAHDDIMTALERAGIHAGREVRLSARDRIDVLSGAVGVEIKTKVGHSRRHIYEQLTRYAEHDAIAALVLASGTAWPRSIGTVGGKPLFFANLTRGWL